MKASSLSGECARLSGTVSVEATAVDIFVTILTLTSGSEFRSAPRELTAFADVPWKLDSLGACAFLRERSMKAPKYTIRCNRTYRRARPSRPSRLAFRIAWTVSRSAPKLPSSPHFNTLGASKNGASISVPPTKRLDYHSGQGEVPACRFKFTFREPPWNEHSAWNSCA